ncbi:DUF393 domain-containing protein [Sneathiella sp. P13V-1]|uniref:DCC1-like thiol-disulfide oxidoreductase family protein n=1 Tax=Sneathiella sp. P13V-1 TaxID=2697366 RepID=UPI00187B68A9|nr:DCC1-like thiol-disulfide oxidoreductase family protein [Sneathiella sp. P13V-1]MBE7635655.1 DUF393 domain-containing protein [Sneathiella sp. P13V-1]
MKPQKENEVWVVYDGDCPVCRLVSYSLRIRKEVGKLNVLNAREGAGHPLYEEILARGLDLDEGMVLVYGGMFYHGADALNMMAILGGNVGWFNRFNAIMFRSPTMARVCYPVLRAGRNFLLWINGVQKIHSGQ